MWYKNVYRVISSYESPADVSVAIVLILFRQSTNFQRRLDTTSHILFLRKTKRSYADTYPFTHQLIFALLLSYIPYHFHKGPVAKSHWLVNNNLYLTYTTYLHCL